MASLPSCRKIMAFFSPENETAPPLKAKTGNPCVDEEPDWIWVGRECRYIPAHFIASTVAYVRTLGEVNQEMFRYTYRANNDFRDIMNAGFDRLYKAIRETGRTSFDQWIHSLEPSWEQAKDANIKRAFQVPYELAYAYLMKEELIGLTRLSDALGRHFFEIIQTEKTRDYPFHDPIYRNALAEAEECVLIAASEWNHNLNKDEAYHAEFKDRLKPLLASILESRSKH